MFFFTRRKGRSAFILSIDRVPPIELKALPGVPSSRSPDPIFKLSG
jgi:hypothetical protein